MKSGRFDIVRAMGLTLMLSAAAAATVPSSGCSRKHPCAVLYEKFKKCSENFPMAEKDFVSMCNEQRHKHVAVVEGQIRCAKKASSCDQFKKCVGEVRQKAIVQETGKALDEAVQAKDWGRALAQCDAMGANLTADLKKRCKQVAETAYKETWGKLVALRDKAAPPTGPSVSAMCILLRSAAQWTGKRNDADALCQVEIRYAKAVADTLAQAAQAAKAAAPAVPPGCVTLPKLLAKARFQTPWVKSHLQALVKGCFVDLGKVVLQKKVGGAAQPKECDPEVQKVLDGLASYKMITEELKPLVDKASKVCKLPAAGAAAGARAARTATPAARTATPRPGARPPERAAPRQAR